MNADNAALVDAACAAVRCLSAVVDVGAALEEGGVDTILGVLGGQKASLSNATSALRALVAVMEGDVDNTKALHELASSTLKLAAGPQGIEAVVGAMTAHPGSAPLQEAGCAALRLMGYDAAHAQARENPRQIPVPDAPTPVPQKEFCLGPRPLRSWW